MRKENIASRYLGMAGTRYSLGRNQGQLLHLGYHLQAKFYLPYLDKTLRVLDFGCGNGSMAKIIEPHVHTIEGLEINEYPRTLAQSELGLTVYAALDEIPAGKKYDVIISNHVFEHIPCVVDVIQALAQLLVSDGKLITVLPIEDFRSPENRKWQGKDINYHLHSWTPRLFANTLREGGMIPEEIHIITSAWTPKLFFLGDSIFQKIFGKVFAVLRHRRQLFACAKKAFE